MNCQHFIYLQFYNPDDGPFSFSDVYAPMTFVAARAGEARVWSFFSKWSNIEGFEDKYYDYAGGWNLTNRMPWSVEPKEKLHVRYLFKFSLIIYMEYSLKQVSKFIR